MSRCLLLVLDGVGVGHAPDAAGYGDLGADTLGHLHAKGLLDVPTLWALGLGRAMGVAGAPARACWGRMRERSVGKDSTTGHWELAGVVLDEPFRVFESFPPALLDAIEVDSGYRCIGNVAASGTAIIDALGAEHLRTGRPILYTSADSVLQIAAHEAALAPEPLYALCRVARRHADRYRIGRVIARPFVGRPGAFRRTPHRHDFSMEPPRTVLDAIREAGLPVHGIGKIGDLFAGRGLSTSNPTSDNVAGMRRTAEIWGETRAGLVFTNLVDFDTEFGHRRDPVGFAAALRAFDDWLGGFLGACRADDLIVITADHGNDPTFRGTDHTREEVPLLVIDGARTEPLGCRKSFADVAATLATRLRLPAWGRGMSFVGPPPPDIAS